MLMVESTEQDPCTCGHMIKSHKMIGKIPRDVNKLPKFKCRFCNCKSLELS